MCIKGRYTYIIPVEMHLTVACVSFLVGQRLVLKQTVLVKSGWSSDSDGFWLNRKSYVA